MENFLHHWSSFDFSIALIVFIVYTVVDGMYAYYTIAVTEKKAMTSANTGALMHFFLAFGVLSYVKNYLYLIPLAIGSWIGTYVVVSKGIKISSK